MFGINHYLSWKTIVVFLCFLMVAATGHARSTELVDPAPVSIPQGLSQEQVMAAVKGALAQKNWSLTSVVAENPRVEEVELRVRAHVMALKIEYLPDTLKFTYSRSDQLNYKVTKDKTLIHPSYLVWSQELADQIQQNLAQGKSFDTSSLPTLKTGNPAPKEAFSAFGQFTFEPVTMAKEVPVITSNTGARTNLEHNIKTAAAPKLSTWNKPGNARTLKIDTQISAVRFIASGARFFVGRMAGRSWIKVKLTFTDAGTGDVINTAELYRMAEAANGYTLARADYAMIENMGKDIIQYIENNYKTPIGGGSPAPAGLQ